MNNNESKKESLGKRHIDLTVESEIKYWSNKFAVTPEVLKRAIIDVGADALLVSRVLKYKSSNAN